MRKNSSSTIGLGWNQLFDTQHCRYTDDANIVRKLNPNAIIVLGGPHCEMFPEYAMAMDNVDAIVVGDGEQAFLDIIPAG